MRVVSFLPSATETVLALGTGDALVGISHDNLHIPAVAQLPVVSTLAYDDSGLSGAEIDALVSATYARGASIYQLDAALLKRLQPDLLLTQELCDVCAVTPNDFQKAIAGLHPFPAVLSLNAHTLAEALTDMHSVAAALGRAPEGERLVGQLTARIAQVTARAAAATRRPRVFCLEWPRPIYNAGHWVPELVACAGGSDALGAPGTDSVRLPWDRVREYDPEIIVAMVCGFPRARAVQELAVLPEYAGFAELRAVRDHQVWVVDGPLHFSQSGPGLIRGLEILAGILQPEIFGEPAAEHALRWTPGTTSGTNPAAPPASFLRA